MTMFLGIDTSAYTTSVALVNDCGEILADERTVLQVDTGKIGLRQSEAHFAHTRNLPGLFERISPFFQQYSLSAVGVSDSPRPREDSYMPVFLAGLSVAACTASAVGCPLYRFSHQEGHIEAAAHGFPLKDRFLAVHFSGGTSEVLLAEKNNPGYEVEIILDTVDLNAGQFVDRVGVQMGLPFPAGPRLEEMADGADPDSCTIPSAMTPRGFSFSGPLTRAQHYIEQGTDHKEVAALVFRCIANTLEKAIRQAAVQTGVDQVLLAGGVMANRWVRERLAHRFENAGITFFWSPVKLSSDNAVGAARLARKACLDISDNKGETN